MQNFHLPLCPLVLLLTLLCVAVSNRNQNKGLPIAPVLCLPGRGPAGTGGRWRERGTIYSSDIIFHLRNNSWSQAFSCLFFKTRDGDTSYLCTHTACLGAPTLSAYTLENGPFIQPSSNYTVEHAICFLLIQKLVCKTS